MVAKFVDIADVALCTSGEITEDRMQAPISVWSELFVSLRS
jgi:hypothetical protein